MARALLATLLLIGGLVGLAVWFVGASGREEAALNAPTAGVAQPGKREAGDLTSPELLDTNGPAVEQPDASVAEVPDAGDSRRSAVGARRGPSSDDLVVVVRDSAGRPAAGVPLRVDANLSEPRRVTDAQGRAVFESAKKSILAADLDFRVVHELPFQEEPVAEFGPAAAEDGTVETRLPPAGAIDVNVKELDGRPTSDGAQVELTLVNEFEEALNPLKIEERPSWTADVRGGVASFPYVELERVWEALGRRPDANVPSRTQFIGPVSPGQRIAVDVTLGSDHPVIRYRALYESGKPVANADLKVTREDFFFPKDHDARTDAKGTFLLDTQGSWLFGGGAIVVSYTDPKGRTFVGRKEVETVKEPGLHEGGDVVLAPDAFLVGGVVVDEQGEPVAGAEVAAGGGRFLSFGGNYALAGAGNVKGKSGADGKFELRGLLGKDEFDVHAYKGSKRADPVKAHEGDTDLRLVLAARWTVSGALVVDDGVSPGLFGIDLSDGEERIDLDRSVESTGHFELQGVKSGLYTLVVTLDGSDIFQLPSIRVTEDMDVGDIDLRSVVSTHTLFLEGASDPAKVQGEVAWRAAGTEDEWKSRRFEGIEVAIVTLEGTFDVWLRPERYRYEQLMDVSGKERVHLRGPLVVVLELETDGELPEYPYIFDPNLKASGVAVGYPDGSRYFTKENRTVRFLVSEPGKVTVGWHLEKHGDSWAIGGDVLQAHKVEIDVLEASGDQRFRVPLDGAALTQLTRNPPY